VALVGDWWVTGAAAAEEEGAVIRLTVDAHLELWRGCGRLSGGWRADGDGLFVGGVSGIGDGCPAPATTHPWTPAWLARVTGYRMDGEVVRLLDLSGAVVARLVPGGHVREQPPAGLAPLEVTGETRRFLAPAAPLPTGLTPATAETLAGRWVAADGERRLQEAHVDLKAGGEWSGSDGCNGTRGRWVAGGGGALLVTSGPSTLMACTNHPAASWLYRARRAAIAGDELILFDRAAKELGRLKRSSTTDPAS
jgi:hypothetical protein